MIKAQFIVQDNAELLKALHHLHWRYRVMESLLQVSEMSSFILEMLRR